MKKLYTALLLAITVFSDCNAQYVNIPDSNFVLFLRATYPECMNGNQMDTACIQSLNITSVYCSYGDISSIEGIEYFTSATYLNCSNNNIDTISNLPPNLLTLDCSNQTALNLIQNTPASLLWLNCSTESNYRYLTFSIPNTLKYLDISGAYVTNLYIPDSLQFLFADASELGDVPGSGISLQYMVISNDDIDSAWLGNLFSNTPPLRYLDCSFIGNGIYPFALPDNLHTLTLLDTLICSDNYLPRLPALPPNLQMLDCSYNYNYYPDVDPYFFRVFPPLPQGLISLYCEYNAFDSLPALPLSLQTLECSYDSLNNLPALSASLSYLDCSINDITSMPPLPSSLTYVDCDYNLLQNLPALPASLNYLSCDGNYLDSLSRLSATSLSTLYCDNNLLQNLSALPISLNFLSCEGNLLDSLPLLSATTLSTLYCGNNQLSNLPALPASLYDLDCDFNPIKVMPTLPAGLNFLEASYLDSLTVVTNFPAYMQTIGLSYDPLLESLPELPDIISNGLSLQGDSNLTCLPQLKKINDIDFSGTNVTCLPDYGSVGGSNPRLSTVPLCGIFNPGNCGVFWDISGQTYFDANRDCLFDSSDVAQQNIKAKLDSAGALLQQIFTGAQGFYSFLDTSGGTYELNVDTTGLPFTLLCPASTQDTAIINAIDTLSYSNNFAFVCKPGYDLIANSIVADAFNPARYSQVNLSAGDAANFYGVSCATGISGTVTLVFNGPIQYVSSAGTLTPSSVSGDTVTWNIADFGAVNFFTDFAIEVQTNFAAIAGDPVCFNLSVTSPLAGDYNTANNNLSQCFEVTTSYDPNSKEVYPQNVYADSTPWLTYTIHFQNTGTAPAFNIYIDDTIDVEHLDVSTIQLLAYSAKTLVQVLPGGILRFSFPNINLPDSTVSDSGSKGYVQYKIRVKDNQPAGSQIQNTAYIYFDFNSPVATNTTLNTVMPDTTTGIVNVAKRQMQFTLFPNPAKNYVIVETSESVIGATMQITDITGREILSKPMVNSQSQIQTSGFSPGVYLVRLLVNGKGKFVRKLVVE